MSIEAASGWDRLAPWRRRNKVVDGNIKLVLHVFRVAGKHETDHGGLRAQKEIDTSISIPGLFIGRSLFCMTTHKVCLFCMSRVGNLSCAYVRGICVLMVSPCQDKMIATIDCNHWTGRPCIHNNKTTQSRVGISQIQHVPVL